METREEKNIYELFRISVLLKGAISIAEVLGGLFILVVPATLVAHLAEMITRGELLEDPTDFIANHILAFGESFTGSLKLFIAFYLLTRGLIKVGLVWALLKNQLWAYPASLIVLFLFVFYQTYQIIVGHSLLIAAITIFDLIVIYFIWREYEIVRKHRTSAT